ncbi:benenodin family lasso peptide [Rhizorhabdus sp. FW153]
MERNEEQFDAAIDLGAASTVTLGKPGQQIEFGVIAEPLALDAD